MFRKKEIPQSHNAREDITVIFPFLYKLMLGTGLLIFILLI